MISEKDYEIIRRNISVKQRTMINQHQQAAIAQGAVPEAIAELQEFIDNRPDAREVRKALAVKLVYQGYKYEEIQTILDVSLGSITSWKQSYKEYGISGLQLNHKGRKGYLSDEQREEVLSWLHSDRYLGAW